MDATNPTNPQDRGAPAAAGPERKRETLERLLRAARKAIADKGLSEARIEDIARAAGVTKQLIYHYFGSKEQLFASVLDDSAQVLQADLLRLDLDALAPTEAMRVLLGHLADQYRVDPDLSALAQESFRQHLHQAGHVNRFTGLVPTLVRLTEGILGRGVAAGEFRAGTDARLFLAAAALLVTGGYTSRYVVSTMAGFDTASAQGAATWREHAIDVAMAVLRPSSSVPISASPAA